MKTPNLFADNLVIQHLKRLPREEWGEEEVLHMYRELENLMYDTIPHATTIHVSVA